MPVCARPGAPAVAVGPRPVGTIGSTEAAIRTKIKHLLRRYGYAAPTGGAGPSRAVLADLILDQARHLYRYWPETVQAEFVF